jgi:hypothetical protein
MRSFFTTFIILKTLFLEARSLLEYILHSLVTSGVIEHFLSRTGETCDKRKKKFLFLLLLSFFAYFPSTYSTYTAKLRKNFEDFRVLFYNLPIIYALRFMHNAYESLKNIEWTWSFFSILSHTLMFMLGENLIWHKFNIELMQTLWGRISSVENFDYKNILRKAFLTRK